MGSNSILYSKHLVTNFNISRFIDFYFKTRKYRYILHDIYFENIVQP